MKCEEPAAGLIYALGNVVGRKRFLKYLLVFKWVMPLCIGHRAGIKPNIDEIGLAEHCLTRQTDQYNVVYVWPMQIKSMVVHNAFRGLNTSLDCFRHFRFQFVNRTNANFFLSVFCSP